MSREEDRKGISQSPKYLSAQQVADRYGLTVQWVYHCEGLRAIGQKFGKYLRYREDLLLEFEKSRPTNRGYDLNHLQNVMRQISETTRIARQRKPLIFNIKD